MDRDKMVIQNLYKTHDNFMNTLYDFEKKGNQPEIEKKCVTTSKIAINFISVFQDDLSSTHYKIAIQSVKQLLNEVKGIQLIKFNSQNIRNSYVNALERSLINLQKGTKSTGGDDWWSKKQIGKKPNIWNK